MAKRQGVSISVIRRLPRYYRFLGDLLNNSTYRISSHELAQLMKLTASQIRQDLNCFGGFGQQGYGYNVEDLYKEIGKILGVEREIPVILVGAGNLGKAVSHMDFRSRGFKLVGAFDLVPPQGKLVDDLFVQPMEKLEDFCSIVQPKAAILCIPKDGAKEVVDRLMEMGVRSFWNFSAFDVAASYDDVVVENVHLGDSMMTLGYLIHEGTQ